MKKLIFLIFIVAILVVPSGAWGEEEWLTYTSKPVEGVTYSLNYPPGWDLKEMSPISVGLMCFDDPKFKTMLTISIQDVRLWGREVMSLDEYLEQYDKNVLKITDNFNRISREKSTLGGREAAITVYTYTDKHDPNWHIKTKSYTAVVKDVLAYEVGYSSAPGTHDQFSETGKKIIDSFKFEQA